MKKLFCRIMIGSYLISASITSAVAAEINMFTVLSLPHSPMLEQPWVKIINNQSDWESHFNATLAAASYPVGQAPVAPELNFDNNLIISGGLGLRSSGGYYLAIASVREGTDALYVHVLDVQPGPRCLVTMALTYPSITVSVRKTGKPIKFTVSAVISQCQE